MVFDIIGKSVNKIVDFGETCWFFKYCELQVVSDCLVKVQRCDSTCVTLMETIPFLCTEVCCLSVYRYGDGSWWFSILIITWNA